MVRTLLATVPKVLRRLWNEWNLYIENLGVYHESQPLSPWNTFVLIKRCINKGFLRAINIFSHHHTWSVSQNVLLETQFDREKKINQEILLWTDRFEKRGLEGRLIEAIYIRDLCIYLAWLVRIRRYEGIIPSYIWYVGMYILCLIRPY